MSEFAEVAGAKRELSELHAGIVQAVKLALRAAVDATAESVKGTGLYKDRTGGTRGSLKKGIEGFTGFVSSGGATRFLENGTQPHDIHGNPYLKFQMNGQWVVTKSVKHPGTAPRPFMMQAELIGRQAADYGAEFFIDHAVSRHNS